MTRVQAALQRRITETEAMIVSASRQFEQLQLPIFVADLELNSLRQRLSDLKRELEDIRQVEGREKITMTLHPPGQPSGRIPVRNFALILGGLQTVVDSVANTIYNQPSAQGRIPNEILEQNTFVMDLPQAGSVIVSMEVSHSPQVTLEEPEQTRTITELFTLFDSSDNTELLFETVSNLGPRTLKHYQEWTKIIQETDTPVDIEWVSPIKGKTTVKFPPEKAGRINEVLGHLSEGTIDNVEVQGYLSGANVRTHTFEITTLDAHLSGRFASEVAQTIKELHLGSEVIAQLLKATTVHRSTGRQKVAWTLRQITPIKPGE